MKKGKLEKIYKQDRSVLIGSELLKVSDKVNLNWFKEGDYVEYTENNRLISFMKKSNTNSTETKDKFKKVLNKDDYFRAKLDIDKSVNIKITKMNCIRNAIETISILKDKLGDDITVDYLVSKTLEVADVYLDYINNDL